MRLLLVEDERKLSQVLAKGLKKLSYTVDQAFDGEEALELFSVYGYDLVVLDLNLPKSTAGKCCGRFDSRTDR